MAKKIRMDELFAKTRAYLGRTERIADGRHTVCREGCSGCCRKVSVPATLLEATLAADCLNRCSDRAVIREIRSNLAAAGRIYRSVMAGAKGDEIVRRLALLNSRIDACPFLVGRRCAIYDSRPFACRVYVSDSPLECVGCPGNAITSAPTFAAIRSALHDGLWDLVEEFHAGLPPALTPGVGVLYQMIIIDSSGEAQVMTPLGPMAVRR